MLKVEHITKKYGNKKAVDDISFTLQKGTAVGFLGPNGAGKSTTMNIITGYIAATEGNVCIDDISIDDDPITYKKKIGYLPEIPPLYLDMTLEEYLRFICAMKKIDRNDKEEIDEIIEMVRLEKVKGRLLKNLSKGYRQRAGFAQALVGRPPLLILDEPTIGLDPSQIVEIRSLLNELKAEHTIFLSSHILSEVTEVCDQIILLNEGKMIANDTQKELTKKQDGCNTMRLCTPWREDEVVKNLVLGILGVQSCSVAKGLEHGMADYTIKSAQGQEVRHVICSTLSANGIPIYELNTVKMSLEDVFIHLTNSGEEGTA
ncbi:ABC transporter ATP-binding protein [Lachnospiraceae bacterium ZAX-1]